jgi:predicted amidohydrolase
MRIAAAQVRPIAGEIARNVIRHCEFAQVAADHDVDLIVFPELSLTGYEPSLASRLAIHKSDPCLQPLQEMSDQHDIVIAAGIPLRSERGVEIGMIWFRPGQPKQSYSKQILHADELPFFVCGSKPMVVSIKGVRLAPAICYESLQLEHAKQAAEFGATVYLSSVAKSASGVSKAFAHYPVVAVDHHMTVMMANSVGPCDNFVAKGCSAVWTDEGRLIAQLSLDQEQLLCYDLVTRQSEIVMV